MVSQFGGWPVFDQDTQPTVAHVAARGLGCGSDSLFQCDPRVAVNVYACSDFDLDVV